MRRVVLVLLPFLVTACGSRPITPTPPATPPAAASSASAPSTTDALTSSPVFLPLPEAVAGIPGPAEPSFVLQPETKRGAIQPGVGRPFQLGHCGLGSPIDFDGSLWNPVAGHSGQGGPLTEDQKGELINATEVMLLVLTPDVAEVHTPLGAAIRIVRLEGARAYKLCD